MTPYALSSVSAGFPTPPDDGQEFDLATYLIKRPEQTFYVKVHGHSMTGRGIEDGDILIVDKSKFPQPSDVVIVQVNNEYTVKQYEERERGRLRLVPANPDYKPLPTDQEARICGVVLFSIHHLSLAAVTILALT